MIAGLGVVALVAFLLVVDDRIQRRRHGQYSGAAGRRRHAGRHAGAQLRVPDPPARVRPVPLERGRGCSRSRRPLIRLDDDAGGNGAGGPCRAPTSWLAFGAALSCSSSPGWASRCRPTACWCWATGATSRCRRSRWRSARLLRRGARRQPLGTGGRPADRDRHAGGGARLLPHARGAGYDLAAPGRQGALAGAGARSRQCDLGAGAADRRGGVYAGLAARAAGRALGKVPPHNLGKAPGAPARPRSEPPASRAAAATACRRRS